MSTVETWVKVSPHPVLQHKLMELRNKSTTPTRFRAILAQLTTMLAYEATAQLATEAATCETPVSSATGVRLAERIALIPVMRAGMGMADAMLDLLPDASVHHIGMYRKHHDLLPVLYYNRLPDVCACDVAIVLEPMVATAGTLRATIDILKEWGAPRIVVISVVGARTGLETLRSFHPDVTVHIGSIDSGRTAEGMIMPGLGDVGDRLYNAVPEGVPSADSASRKRARAEAS
jgi:uracil phosphoribosyltransferase|tara:strand:+ start:171 stop:869 length:699 start_codon:yes stop_codon:yes gene_type:complete